MICKKLKQNSNSGDITWPQTWLRYIEFHFKKVEGIIFQNCCKMGCFFYVNQLNMNAIHYNQFSWSSHTNTASYQMVVSVC